MTPDLKHYEKLCRMTVTGGFLKWNGINATERQWFAKQLPKKLNKLRKARRCAEHETASTWNRGKLKEFIEEFLGIGQSGTIPRLIKLLGVQSK